LEISFGVFSSSRSIIISDMHLRISTLIFLWRKERKKKGSNCSAVFSDEKTDERKGRKGSNCFVYFQMKRQMRGRRGREVIVSRMIMKMDSKH
jgi:hypothetical protein